MDSTQVNNSATPRRRAIPVQRTRLAFGLDGCLAVHTHTSKRTNGIINRDLEIASGRIVFAAKDATLHPGSLLPVLLETQVNKCQKN